MGKEKELFEGFQLMCLNKGYGLEEYTVTTEDNYKLQLFRIINKKLDPKSPKQPVLFQHGLLDSSDGWICNYEKNCIPFILCKKGFDYVGNSRGNKHSKYVEREEGGRDPSKDNSYWNFSFHEMGLFDIPAFIEKVISINRYTQKVIYFGHSQGGASILAGMCEKLEYYQQKLRGVVLLAPASRIDSHDSTFLTFLKNLRLEEQFMNNNIFEIFPYDPFMKDLNIQISNVYPTLHYALVEMTSDEVSLINCPERIKFFLAHYPSGTSLKSLLHLKQMIIAKCFQAYDYGPEENLKLYATSYPKQYDLTKIEGIPIILCGGINDKLTHINDIRWLKSQLKQTLFSYYEFDQMGHLSFLINNDITWFNFILRDLFKIMEKNKIIRDQIPDALNNDINIENDYKLINEEIIIPHVNLKSSKKEENGPHDSFRIKSISDSHSDSLIFVEQILNDLKTEEIKNYSDSDKVEIEENNKIFDDVPKENEEFNSKAVNSLTKQIKLNIINREETVTEYIETIKLDHDSSSSEEEKIVNLHSNRHNEIEIIDNSNSQIKFPYHNFSSSERIVNVRTKNVKHSDSFFISKTTSRKSHMRLFENGSFEGSLNQSMNGVNNSMMHDRDLLLFKFAESDKPDQ